MPDCNKKFTTQEAKIIRELLEKKSRASRSEQKSIRATLRRMNFNISCFRKSSAAFDHLDFDFLIHNSLIEIVLEDNIASRGDVISSSKVKLSGLKSDEADEASEELRQSFMPKKVEVLYIGESPPAIGTFFYKGNSRLYQCVHESFQTVFPDLDNDPDNFLQQFSQMGCYLDDLCLIPVNGLSKSERFQAGEEGIADLSRRISILNPQAIITVMKGIASQVSRAIHLSGISVRYSENSTFPANSQANETNCIKDNVYHLNRMKELGILRIHPSDRGIG